MKQQKNFNSVCRLCLSESEFKYSLLASNVLEKIEALVPTIQVSKDDGLPKSCCKSCFENICDFYKFKQGILQSDTILRDMLHKSETDSEILGSTERLDVSYSEKVDVVIKEETDDKNELEHDMKFESNTTKTESIQIEIEPIEQKAVELAVTCSQCSKTFPTKNSLSKHLLGHRVKKCPICGMLIRRDNLSKHIVNHNSPPVICDICGKVAKNVESLRGHLYYMHRKITPVKCEYCNKEMKKKQYHAHLRNVHLGIRNHQCHVCGKKFYGGHELRTHIKMTHDGSRPHICQYCKRGYSSPYALKTHIRQHTNETPYPCEYCDDAFRQKVSLVTHLKSKHKIILKNNKTDIGSVAQIEHIKS